MKDGQKTYHRLPPKKICLLLPGLNAGGTENYVLRYLRHFSHVDNYTIVVRSGCTGDLFKEYTKLPIEISYKPIGFLNPVRWYAFYTFLSKRKFDSLCDFNGNFGGIPLLIGKISGIEKRLVFYRRSSDAFEHSILKAMYNKLVNYLVYKCSTKILSNSHEAIENFFNYRSPDDPRFKVIYNGINFSELEIKYSKRHCQVVLGIDGRKHVIGHVGRYDPSKNHETIFRVARTIKSYRDDVVFVFCGRGTESLIFRDLLVKFDIDDICLTLGVREDIPLVYHSFDLFIFPSITEGQPNALIEAMGIDLPIIASNIKPIKECTPDHVLHNLIDPYDVEKYCKTILGIIDGDLDIGDFQCGRFVREKFEADLNFLKFREQL